VAVMLGGEVVLAVGSKGRGDSRKRDNREWVPIRIAGDREISGILWTAGPQWETLLIVGVDNGILWVKERSVVRNRSFSK